MTMVQTTQETLLQETTTTPALATLPEVKTMLRIVGWIGWANLFLGIPSVLLVLSFHSISLAFSGFLSILTFWLLRMAVKHIAETRSWTELGVIAMCGVYFPSFIMWLSASNLIEVILR